MRKVAKLRAVIAERGTIIIIYNGGSAPGTARAIAPISVDDDKLVARCLESNSRKTFLLDKVVIAGGDPIIPRPHFVLEDMAALKNLRRMTLLEFGAAIQRIASDGGWTLEITESRIDGRRNGQSHHLDYAPMTADVYIGPDDLTASTRPSERPWHLDGRLFTHKERAFAAFVDALRSPEAGAD